MADWRWFSKLHDLAYRLSGGRVGGSMMGIPMLRLTTVGRRSGQPRTLPLAFYPDGEDWVIVASNNGQDHHPAWWLNLEAHPEASIQVGATECRVRAGLADPQERARLWPKLIEANPHYARYETKTEREIPVVILRRIGEGVRTESP